MSAVWIAIAVLSALGTVFGGLLGYASRRFKVEEDPIVEQIDAILPQSQCGQCGYPLPSVRGCGGQQWRDDQQMRPRGEQTMLKLAALLNVDPQPLGDEAAREPERKVAWIDEENCIGCTKCIQACPVDAIVGATRAMHTVLSDVCTGCDLCVAPCPTDCIEMRPVATTTANWKWDLNTIPVRVIPVEHHA